MLSITRLVLLLSLLGKEHLMVSAFAFTDAVVDFSLGAVVCDRYIL